MAKKNKVNASSFSGLLSGPKVDTTTDETQGLPTPTTGAQPIRGRGHKSTNRRTMVGAGVTAQEKVELQAIADAEGVALNAVLAFFIRDAMTRYKMGKLKIPRKTITVIDMPK